MKLLAILCCIATLGLLTSCSKSNEDLILGKWKCVASHISGEDDDNEAVGNVWEFKSDGTVIMTETDGDIDYGTYTINETNLSVTSNGMTIPGQIAKLTNKKLIVDFIFLTTIHLEFDKM